MLFLLKCFVLVNKSPWNEEEKHKTINWWICKHLPCFVAKSRSVCRSSRIAREWSIAHLSHPAKNKNKNMIQSRTIRLLHFNLVNLTTLRQETVLVLLHNGDAPDKSNWSEGARMHKSISYANIPNHSICIYKYIYIIFFCNIYYELFTHKCVKTASIT